LRLTIAVSDIGDMEKRGWSLALPTDESSSSSSSGRFGSAHPGVVLFCFGDGSVRSVALTTPANILAALGTVNDGTTVTLP